MSYNTCKFFKLQNFKHLSHISGKFARTSIRALEEIAAFSRPEEVTFLSQDGKAKVPSGITITKKQIPMLMYMEYSVTLPDHDYVVGLKHKLILFVILK